MKKIITSAIVFAIIALFFLYGITIYPHSAQLPSGASLEAPSLIHWIGTDNLGIDIYAQLASGFFRSISIGLAAALLSFVLGGGFGILAGYVGGKTDAFISFLINVLLSVPQLPIMILIGAFFGQSTMNIILIIAAFSWAPIAKQMRAKTISIKSTQYVKLAECFGGSPQYIVKKHLSRELMPLLVVTAMDVIGKAIIQESSLAYLGLSDPLARSWGLMIAKATAFPGIFFTDFWIWWVLPPVLTLMFSVLNLRLLGKAVESYWLKRI